MNRKDRSEIQDDKQTMDFLHLLYFIINSLGMEDLKYINIILIRFDIKYWIVLNFCLI